MGFDRYVEELTHGADPDIAEPEIHFASKVTRDLSQRTDCLGIADVSWHHQHLRVQGATVRCDNLQILAAARGKHERPALFCEGLCRRPTDAAGCAHDDCGSALSWRSHHRVPPFAFLRPNRVVSRSEEHTSELQSLMRISYAVFCLKKKKQQYKQIK